MEMEQETPACESCKISFVASHNVFAALCGHLFHESCVNRINGGRCPECQITCNPSQLLRIYLPFQRETSTPESLVSNYKMMKHELKEVQREYLYEQQVQLNLDNLIGKSNAIVDKKNEKVAELKALNKEKEKLQKKMKKLEKINAVQKAMIGSQKDVEQLVNQKQSADTLATMVAVMKKETNRIEAEKTDIRSGIREDQKESKVLGASYRGCRDKLEIAVARSIKNKGGQN